VAVSFIGGGNMSTCRKPKSTANDWYILLHNVLSSTSRHE